MKEYSTGKFHNGNFSEFKVLREKLILTMQLPIRKLSVKTLTNFNSNLNLRSLQVRMYKIRPPTITIVTAVAIKAGITNVPRSMQFAKTVIRKVIIKVFVGLRPKPTQIRLLKIEQTISQLQQIK